MLAAGAVAGAGAVNKHHGTVTQSTPSERIRGIEIHLNVWRKKSRITGVAFLGEVRPSFGSINKLHILPGYRVRTLGPIMNFGSGQGRLESKALGKINSRPISHAPPLPPFAGVVGVGVGGAASSRHSSAQAAFWAAVGF